MNKDSKYTDIQSNLNAIGKKVFVDFYYDFKNLQIHDSELSEKLFQNNPLSKSPKQGFRIPRARHIFETNQQIDALRLIIKSEKLDKETIDKAKGILDDELAEWELLKEHEEELIFINDVNVEIAYGTDEGFEYDYTPKKPKTVSKTSYQIIRDVRTSKNALYLAGYKCEFDNSHYLFKRKHCNIDYTEPHHLIPLAAQKDFPNISLDCEQNIVSLCCNCHKQVHYGANIDVILKPLYEKRYPLLKQLGIDISYDELKKYYK